MSEYILTHKHQTHNHPASGWHIHCGVEVTEWRTNKQHTLSVSRKESRPAQLRLCVAHNITLIGGVRTKVTGPPPLRMDGFHEPLSLNSAPQ